MPVPLWVSSLGRGSIMKKASEGGGVIRYIRALPRVHVQALPAQLAMPVVPCPLRRAVVVFFLLAHPFS
jgi:hypothetical protein